MSAKKELIDDTDLKWIAKYIQNPSPTGNEQSGQRIWLERIRPYVTDHFSEVYGCTVAVVNPGQEFKVIIEAHADEIAWYVHKIGTDGFIHVEETGGTDPGIAPSQKVTIHTKKGAIPAIFGWPAIHARETSDDAPKKSSIFLDCGCTSKEEVEELGIQVGDYITYDAGFFVLNSKYFVGRALDNRIGGFMTTKIAQLLKERNIQLPYTLYIVNAVQEENGTKGAEMIAERIKPNCAIVIDVTHDTSTPMMETDKEGVISTGIGPVITKSPPIHLHMRELLVETARENNIPFQLAAVAKQTGTDADAFAYKNGGIATCLVSLPLRYMHTTVETVHKDDVEHAIELIFAVLKKITPDMNLQYV
jgi:putative aminopeptidase FrvX